MPPVKRSAASLSPTEDAPSLSSKIEDRSSSFLALYSPNLPKSSLLSHSAIAGASHRITAWRRPSTQKTIYPGAAPILETGWDDDGESWAGKRVLGVMEAMKVQGTVVVGRWWGGIMLGPIRFTHIETVARRAIEACREGENEGDKRRKVENVEPSGQKDVKELAETLATRDEHILILRKLLEEKKEELELQNQKKASADDRKEAISENRSADEGAEAIQPTLTATQDTPKVDRPKPGYESMTIATLKRLEQARDKTIGFVLAEIEKVEKKLGHEEKEGVTSEAANDGT